MTVKSILLVEASDMTSEYNAMLLKMLLPVPGLKQGDKLNIATNSKIRSNHPIFQAFNVYLKKLYREGTVRLIINL